MEKTTIVCLPATTSVEIIKKIASLPRRSSIEHSDDTITITFLNLTDEEFTKNSELFFNNAVYVDDRARLGERAPGKYAAFENENKTADAETARARYDICKTCDNFNSLLKICKLCGCFMPIKTQLAMVSCPDRPPRWNAIVGRGKILLKRN